MEAAGGGVGAMWDGMKQRGGYMEEGRSTGMGVGGEGGHDDGDVANVATC